jgi:perosamine synthetase
MKVPYYIPWITISDKNMVLKSLNSRWLTNGPLLKKFEKSISDLVGTKHSIGVGSATQALHLSLLSLNIKPGDEVIVPTFTFAATANAVIYCGGKPVFVDVDPNSFTIDPQSIKKKITKKTKAIIPVHYGGQSCDMQEIQSIAKKNKFFILEDCAHALGSTYKNKKCGNMGHLGCFSFYPTKVITTGEGGMITTNNSMFSKKIQLLRSQGMSILPHQRESKNQWKYDITELGFNYRLDEIRSALGISQLKRISLANKKRIHIAKQYDELLQNIEGIHIPKLKENRNHIYHLYSIRITEDFHISRNKLFSKLSKHGIGTSVQYYPLHLMSFFKENYPQKNDDFHVSNLLKDQILCLPIFPTMNKKQIEYVVKTIISK